MEFWSSSTALPTALEPSGTQRWGEALGISAARQLLGVAIRPDGRVQEAQRVWVDVVDRPAPPGVSLLLQHSGPAASRWSSERAVAAADVLDPKSHRRARAISADEFDAVVADYAAAARAAHAAGYGVVVDVADDGLLHQALSPLLSPSRPDLVLRVVAACAPCALRIVVEDLAPGGLDLCAGLDAVMRAAELSGGGDPARGEDVVVVTAGSAWLAPLYDRHKGSNSDASGVALASSAFAVGRLTGRRVFGEVSAATSAPAVIERTRAVGLDGVLVTAQPATNSSSSPTRPARRLRRRCR